RVSGEEILYNTADGTPWFIREIGEYLRYTGDLPFLEEVFPFLAIAIEGAISKLRDDLGFFLHGDADTWMDARIEGGAPWSARGNRAIEVQALWYTALRSAAKLARIQGEEKSLMRWNDAADLLKKNFFEAYFDQGKGLFADRLRPDGSADLKCRPNQLLAISVPFEDRLLSPEQEASMLEKALGALLYPHGLASLSQEDPIFHPFHEKWELYHKDAAYHNGTVWGWNAGFAISAMARFGHGEEAYELTKNLVDQILEMGCLGTMSELVDALPGPEGRIRPSGAWSQAWSVAEFVRNATQDFIGFKPNLTDGEIVFSPCIPWSTCSAILPFGSGASFFLDFFREGGEEVYKFSFSGFKGPLRLRFGEKDCLLEEGERISLRQNSKEKMEKNDLPFLAPRIRPGLGTVEKRDFLRDLILRGRFA
ncbi:MAG TPA: amylo-alpha-1,6-glucosidase, partial [Chroococcales cyanobacterium]